MGEFGSDFGFRLGIRFDMGSFGRGSSAVLEACIGMLLYIDMEKGRSLRGFLWVEGSFGSKEGLGLMGFRGLGEVVTKTGLRPTGRQEDAALTNKKKLPSS